MYRFLTAGLCALMLISGAPLALAEGDTQGPEISTITPLEADHLVPQLFHASADDPSGVEACHLMVSSNRDTMVPMTYNEETNVWDGLWVFADDRVANSIRAVCTDTLGNETVGPPRIMTVANVPIDTPDGEAPPVDTTELPDEVDATEWTAEAVIETSPVLIKTVCPGGEDVNHPCRAVYFLDNEGTRHAFPNEKAYFTWYDAFINIHLVTDETMASYSLGRNVRYRPGSSLVKFPSLNTVYTVGAHGMLRAITSEEMAIANYGGNWNHMIDDISEAFFGNYQIGDDILHNDDEYFSTDFSGIASINDNLGF